MFAELFAVIGGQDHTAFGRRARNALTKAPTVWSAEAHFRIVAIQIALAEGKFRVIFVRLMRRE